MKLLVSLLLLASLAFAAEVKLGKPLTLAAPVSIAELNTNPAEHLGKMVQVKGRITEVCQQMGCWMQLVDPNTKQSIRIKVKDGEIAFPKDAAGKTALAEGKLEKLELTKEQAVARAKHEAEEQGRKFNPSSVKGPVTIYQIQGTGAVILD